MTEFSRQHLEKLEVLAGTRGAGARGKAAIRVDDLLPLLALPKLKSSPVASAPTVEEFNALRADVVQIHERLFAIAEILRQAK